MVIIRVFTKYDQVPMEFSVPTLERIKVGTLFPNTNFGEPDSFGFRNERYVLDHIQNGLEGVRLVHYREVD